MTDSSKGRIRMPLARRIHLWRHKYLSVTVWVMVLVATLAYMYRQPHRVTTTGSVEVVESTVAPLKDGTLIELSVGLLDEVTAGQTIAVMDGAEIRAELATCAAESARLRAQLEANELELQRTASLQERKDLDDQRRFAVNAEQAQLDLLRMKAEQESDKVELERLKLDMEHQRTLVGEQMATQEAYDDARLRYEVLKKKITETEGAIATALQRKSEASERLSDLSGTQLDTDLQTMLTPLKRAVEEQETRMEEITVRLKQLVLTAPVAGQVTQVRYQCGETVPAGQSIVIIRAALPPRVVAYVDERALVSVPVGATAKVWSRYRPWLSARGKVARVGGQIDLPGDRFQGKGMMPQHGLEVVVDDIRETAFYPGELVNVRLE